LLCPSTSPSLLIMSPSECDVRSYRKKCECKSHRPDCTPISTDLDNKQGRVNDVESKCMYRMQNIPQDPEAWFLVYDETRWQRRSMDPMSYTTLTNAHKAAGINTTLAPHLRSCAQENQRRKSKKGLLRVCLCCDRTKMRVEMKQTGTCHGEEV
jgi:hypothetical protein